MSHRELSGHRTSLETKTVLLFIAALICGGILGLKEYLLNEFESKLFLKRTRDSTSDFFLLRSTAIVTEPYQSHSRDDGYSDDSNSDDDDDDDDDDDILHTHTHTHTNTHLTSLQDHPSVVLLLLFPLPGSLPSFKDQLTLHPFRKVSLLPSEGGGSPEDPAQVLAK